MERFEEFERRITRSLANMDAKMSYLHESTGQLQASFTEFQEDINEFMSYMAEHITDHEKRLSRLEKHAGFWRQSTIRQTVNVSFCRKDYISMYPFLNA